MGEANAIVPLESPPGPAGPWARAIGPNPPPKRRAASFRLHLIGILLAALLPASLIAMVAVRQEIAASRAEFRTGLQDSARILALAVEAEIGARRALAVALAAMAANGSGLQTRTLRNLALAWVLTLPVAITLAGSLYWVLHFVF